MKHMARLTMRSVAVVSLLIALGCQDGVSTSDEPHFTLVMLQAFEAVPILETSGKAFVFSKIAPREVKMHSLDLRGLTKADWRFRMVVEKSNNDVVVRGWYGEDHGVKRDPQSRFVIVVPLASDKAPTFEVSGLFTVPSVQPKEVKMLSKRVSLAYYSTLLIVVEKSNNDVVVKGWLGSAEYIDWLSDKRAGLS